MDLTLDLGNSGLIPSGSTRRAGTGVVRLATNLWPYAGGYQLWAGDCLDSDPLTTGDARANPVSVVPATVATANVDLARLAVTVKRGAAGISGVTVVAVHAADSSCATGDLVTLGATGAGGLLKVSLPYGTWTLQAVGQTKSGSWPITTVRRGQAAAAAQVNIT
jgi:hypothetical protein